MKDYGLGVNFAIIIISQELILFTYTCTLYTVVIKKEKLQHAAVYDRIFNGILQMPGTT